MPSSLQNVFGFRNCIFNTHQITLFTLSASISVMLCFWHDTPKIKGNKRNRNRSNITDKTKLFKHNFSNSMHLWSTNKYTDTRHTTDTDTSTQIKKLKKSKLIDYNHICRCRVEHAKQCIPIVVRIWNLRCNRKWKRIRMKTKGKWKWIEKYRRLPI